ncbi:sigma-70 family RNA polymerase sigma factor [uncultured Algoriphagus sp.]|uniref:RNA polymerase sigma factor n=1 Tax=uncultured Algoriphagus sp. TaxID=417365 RepID=UPI0030EEA968|tara:strand:+ start:10974 stop:11660 length:687 start_codon:yes stop_codon:yes gene_type:complete
MTHKNHFDDFSTSERSSKESVQLHAMETGQSLKEEDSDSTIWSAFVQGSEYALSLLFERYADKLFNYGKQFSSDTGLVNDAIQDVFYQLIKTKDRLSSAQSVKHYIFSSFRRRLLRLLKQRKNIVFDENIGLSGKFQLSFTPDYHSISTQFTVDQKVLLENACNQLPARQREILALYFFEGLSYKEIADIMEFSQVKSARKLLYRSLEGLSELLGKHRDLLSCFYFFI